MPLILQNVAQKGKTNCENSENYFDRSCCFFCECILFVGNKKLLAGDLVTSKSWMTIFGQIWKMTASAIIMSDFASALPLWAVQDIKVSIKNVWTILGS